MTPEQESAAAAALAEGLSEREAAKRTGVSPTSVHRLRERLAAAGGSGKGQDEDHVRAASAVGDEGVTAAMDAELAGAAHDGEMAELARIRTEITDALDAQTARAEASASAIRDLEQQQSDRLAAGLDAAALRPRLRDARDDLADWAKSIALLRQRLAEADARIALLDGRKELAALRAELDAAAAGKATADAGGGDRQRAAVLAVRAAAEDFCLVVAEQEAAAAKVAALTQAVAARAQQLGEPAPVVPQTVPTGVGAEPAATAGGPLALTRAVYAARAGNLQAVAQQLGEANGYLPPAPPTAEELKQGRQLAEQRQAELRRLQEASRQGIGAERADDRLVPVSFDIDGVPLNRYGDRLVPRGSLPHPLDVYREGYASSMGPFGQPGYRTGY